jgi:hypothetical protein
MSRSRNEEKLKPKGFSPDATTIERIERHLERNPHIYGTSAAVRDMIRIADELAKEAARG